MMRWSAALGIGLVVSLAVPGARADDLRQVCAQAYEKAQYARKDRKLREAKKQLVTCAQAECPAATRRDCTPWLAEVEGQLPTVVFGANDAAGKELVDVKISIDGGTVLAEKLDGATVEIDPGAHKFRFERVGAPDVEETFVIREGEKNRIIAVRFKGASEPPPPPPGQSVAPEAPASGPTYLPAALLTGAGVLAIGGAVIFGVGAKDDADALRTTCAPRCPTSRVDDIRSKLLVSDLFLGVGIVSLGLAAYFFVSPPGAKKSAEPRPAAPLFDVRAHAGGWAAGLTGRF